MLNLIDTPRTRDAATPALPAAEQVILRVLEQDWRHMCNGTLVPSHAQLDPRALNDALPYAFLLHRTAPDSIRVRVAGQRLHDMLRLDPRGMSFGSFFTDGARDTVMALVGTAFDGPAIVGVPLTASRGLGRKPLQAELLLLPMRDSEGVVTRMMGALVSAGPHSRALRFDIARDAVLRHDPLNLGFADRRTNRRRPLPAGRPNLRLVVDNS
mgnify:CR=1 FL=1